MSAPDRKGIGLLAVCATLLLPASNLAYSQSTPPSPGAGIRHSFLVLGARTVIISENDQIQFEGSGGSRDGFVLPTGNLLIGWGDRVEEITRTGQVVLSYRRSEQNQEIGTAQRLYNGNTLVTELGSHPRLLEISPRGEIVLELPLQPETDNAHMQTRMARQLKNGNYLVPHLLAFALKEYSPEGRVVRVLRTDLAELGGRTAENWPFTAIRLDNGNTLVSLTHGNKVVEFNPQGEVAWKVLNSDVHGLFKDPCGVQRLANGNTVVGSHGASTGVAMLELTPDKKIVWTTDHPAAAAVHHFQILTTNGRPEPGQPLK
jgi:Mala s 1-like protein